MSFRVKKQVCILLIGILIFLAMLPVFFMRKKQPEGEYITKEEVMVLAELLTTVLENRLSSATDSSDIIQKQMDTISVLKDKVSQWEVEEYVTYEQFKEWEDVAGEVFYVLEEEELSKASLLNAIRDVATHKQEYIKAMEESEMSDSIGTIMGLIKELAE